MAIDNKIRKSLDRLGLSEKVQFSLVGDTVKLTGNLSTFRELQLVLEELKKEKGIKIDSEIKVG